MSTPQYDYSLLKRAGADCFISARAVFRRPHLVEVGAHTNIDEDVIVTTRAVIGDYVHIAPQVTIIGGGEAEFLMEDFATIAAGSRVICRSDDHLGAGLVGPTIPDAYHDKVSGSRVILRRFANVATNAIIMPDVELAEGTVVGAGALVRESTEPWGIYVGAPARRIRDRPREVMERFAKAMGY